MKNNIKKFFIALGFILSFAAGWGVHLLLVRSAYVNLMSLTTSKDPNYMFEVSSIKCRPMLKTGECSQELDKTYSWVINEVKKYCPQPTTTVVTKPIYIPAPTSNSILGPHSTLCRPDWLTGGVKCSPSY